MKRLVTALLVIFTMSFCMARALAAESTLETSAPEISATITSPTYIEGKPVYDADIQIVVKNLTDHEIKNLSCFLMVADVGKQMTLPVDEFGSKAYQTRIIDSLPANSETTVTIPVGIIYVGTFKISASVMDMEKNYIVTAAPLTVEMIITSKINKTLVMAVSAIVPIFLALGTLYLSKRKRKKA